MKKKDLDLQYTRHATFDIKLHIIFVTKFRKKVFTDKMFVLCEKVFKAILEKNGCVLYEFNGESDHMHLLVGVRPTNSVSVLVNSLKGVSARMLNKEFKELSKVFYGKNIGIWSRAYYVSSVGGVSLDTLKKYIREQNHPL